MKNPSKEEKCKLNRSEAQLRSKLIFDAKYNITLIIEDKHSETYKINSDLTFDLNLVEIQMNKIKTLHIDLACNILYSL